MDIDDHLNIYDRQAGRLQDLTRRSELDKTEVFEEEEVRRATVYARQDIVLLVSYLSSVNKQLSVVRVLLLLIFVALICGFIWK